MARKRSLVAKRVEEIREAKGWSRQRLADEAGITRLQVWRLETGATEMSADAASMFATALDVSVASLYREGRAS